MGTRKALCREEHKRDGRRKSHSSPDIGFCSLCAIALPRLPMSCLQQSDRDISLLFSSQNSSSVPGMTLTNVVSFPVCKAFNMLCKACIPKEQVHPGCERQSSTEVHRHLVKIKAIAFI